ncbi:DUF3800 domain-containing protein [Hymenobacter sp. BT523]|uniref:DUF3800 domain-containing protein n=1 Tax=Hymenobacter sp. BT523 TaxID=2795725 RepID=UPI0018EDF117|nr:DUF3800 domain-containing protein [Hymenobacter sp. BT523]MBJ6108864.1 DUF3800 domain-containing protein [Hymenobacter sp. BT523]
MQFLYVDESGDSGLTPTSPVQYFFLAGLAIDPLHLQAISADLHRFRQHLAAKYGLLISEEIHASAFLSKPGPVARIPLNDRLRILLECVDWCRRRTDVQLLAVGTDKRQAVTNTVFQDVWRQLLRLFDAHLATAGPAQGLVFCDNTDGTKLTHLMHSLRQPAGAPRGAPLQHVIGDPVLWDSRTSYLHHMVDVIAYFAKQLYEPNRRVREKGAHRYFHRLAPINVLVQQQQPPIWMV